MTKLWVVCALRLGLFPCVEVTKVYDGDTITVNILSVHPLFGKDMPVRIRGIDAPEMYSDNPCEAHKAELAKGLVTTLVLNQKVDLVEPSRDKYFRIDAGVRIGKLDVATELLKNKLAVPYDGGTKAVTDWCKGP